MTQIRDVEGFCPVGCGRTLHLMPSGLIACLAPDCPDRGAVSTILSDPETGHIVELSQDTWSAVHPLRERVNHELLSCPLGELLTTGEGVPLLGTGRYRVTEGGGPGHWNWARLDQEQDPES